MKTILPYAYQHVYERAKDCGVIFYNDLDRLVYYTTTATMARKYGIKVPAASIMYTHTHKAMIAQNYHLLEQCENDILSSFARAYNYHHSRKGQLFERHFGHAQKSKPKAIRQIIAYIFNNHVEKDLCSIATEERWSLLAYAFSDHPFSMELNRKNASKCLLRFIKSVDRHILRNEKLCYSELQMMFKGLKENEKEQLIDYIISHYAMVDFDLSFNHFESKESMINVLNNTTGSEYDIREVFYRESDVAYRQMSDILKRKYHSNVFRLSTEEKLKLATMFRIHTDATVHQIESFLHISLCK